MDQRHITLAFTQEADCLAFLMRDQILIEGRYPMRVFRWAVGFSTEKETSLASVWVRFPLLSLNLFKTEALKQVCKPLGKFLAPDNATLNFTRPSYARARVEIDLLAPRVDEIFIGFSEDPGQEDLGYFQKVVYERVPHYCTTCYKQGHSSEVCRLAGQGGPGNSRREPATVRGRPEGKGGNTGGRIRSRSGNRINQKQNEKQEGENQVGNTQNQNVKKGIASTSGTKDKDGFEIASQEGTYAAVREEMDWQEITKKGEEKGQDQGSQKQSQVQVNEEEEEKGKVKDSVVEGGSFHALGQIDEEGNQINSNEIDPGPSVADSDEGKEGEFEGQEDEGSERKGVSEESEGENQENKQRMREVEKEKEKDYDRLHVSPVGTRTRSHLNQQQSQVQEQQQKPNKRGKKASPKKKR
ncbi:PREDICTED: ABC transporter F family member 4-like [Ipomoea nil]|uniref:ABC transporter F family member 4-like n=1 Tax=Ipomoea nil TaxID=35883 RepID=UPI0009014095|nr:PREDICTED: ABC transporter F family member 4-like [Ipomoea nil]